MCLSEIAAGKVTDHYLTLPHVIVHTTIKIFFASVAPQVGVALLIEIFVVVGFISLQMSSLHIVIAWVLMTLGFGGLFLGSNLPVELPDDTFLDRVAALLAFVLPIGACSAVGFFASVLRKSLYLRTQELRRANARIEELASRDELTGALNRRKIMQAFADEIERCRDGTACSSIALIDIDWFKRINDIHGHPAGDAVLRKFAATIQSRIGVSDLFGRYGGEEFLLIMPNRNFDAAFDLVESLRREIDALSWATSTSPLDVTFSGGVAPIAKGLSLEGILSRADAAMYMAKRDGRNQVHMDLQRQECA